MRENGKKKRVLGFEEAHSLVLSFVYLPIPEFIVLMLFREGIVCTVMAFLMVVELLAAMMTYMIWHRCPGCKKVVAQFHVHRDCKCHHCGRYLLQEQVVLKK